MGGKRLDDDDVSTWSSQRRSAYERGCADTHERYATMQAQAHAWLSDTLNVIAYSEKHGTPSNVTTLLRLALNVGDLPLACSCDDCAPVEQTTEGES